MTTKFTAILYAVENGVATITLNRPQALNSYNEDIQNDLLTALDLVDDDDDVRAVIVTGAGRAFCAGADLSAGEKSFEFEGEKGSPDPAEPSGLPLEPLRDGGGLVTLRIFRCLKPLIAAVNGPAVGIGATMQLPMDVRIAAADAKFGFVFARRGVVPEAASSWFLPRIVGISSALEWCYSGRLIPAAEAMEAGLVRSIHPSGDLLQAAHDIAHSLVDHSAPVSIALTRQLLWRGLGLDHPMGAHRIDSKLLFSRARSQDIREGIGSFLEKRAARFPDRVSRDLPALYPWWDEPEYS